LKVKISISQWRHIATWLLNHHSALALNHLAPVASGFASAILRVHDETNPSFRLPSGAGFHMFFQTMRASGIWHNLLGLTSNLLRDMNHPNHTTAGAPKHDNHHIGRASDTHTRVPSGFITDIAEELKRVLIPQIMRLNTQMRANNLGSLLKAVGLNVQSPISRPAGESITHILHLSQLPDLRQFLECNTASFKHPQQALAVELIASKNASLLIGPTGTFPNLHSVLAD
jgi:hypothetical protein